MQLLELLDSVEVFLGGKYKLEETQASWLRSRMEFDSFPVFCSMVYLKSNSVLVVHSFSPPFSMLHL